MGKVVKSIVGGGDKPKPAPAYNAAAEKAKADAAATAAANAELADQRRRQRGQRGLLSSEDSGTVLSSGNKTANATVLGSGGK